ncbi:MAG: ATP synthase F1 subunit gamma [Planctomycetota bacterium]|nr:ATP synthase F1 subunit gamma [Planctomycetota bacterium]
MAKAGKVKKRARAVRSIRDVTKTIEMVASVRFQQTHRAAAASRPYSSHLAELVSAIAAQSEDGAMEHPLLKANHSPTTVLLVIAGNRGLCGGFNGAVLRAAAHARQNLIDAGRQVELHLAGRKAVEFFRFRRIPIAARYELAEIPNFAQVQPLANDFMAAFLAGKIRGVEVAYTRFVSAGQQYPVVEPLLPLTPEAHEPQHRQAHVGFEMHPSPRALLEALLPATVRLRLFSFCLDSVVSEQIARIAAMRAASDNANDMMKDLTRQYNRLRQAKITTELTEIVGGQAGLE